MCQPAAPQRNGVTPSTDASLSSSSRRRGKARDPHEGETQARERHLQLEGALRPADHLGREVTEDVEALTVTQRDGANIRQLA